MKYYASDVITWWTELEKQHKYEILDTERYWLNRRIWDDTVDVNELRTWMTNYWARRRYGRTRVWP